MKTLNKRNQTLPTRHCTNKIALILLTVAFFSFVILGLFRNTGADENIYLRETMIMSECIRNGKWFGDYGVGLHGFIFKIPVALVFLIIGPSVFTATLFNVILATTSAWLFYKILYNNFKFRGWALAGTILLITNFQFVQSTPTYLREIPALLGLLLFTESILSKRKPCIQGIALMILLDAKEYLFFIAATVYTVWIILTLCTSLKQTTLRKYLPKTTLQLIQVLLPSITYIILMFTTSIIPINMFIASILGFVKDGLRYQSKHFSTFTSTPNIIGPNARTIFQFPLPEKSNVFWGVLTIANTILLYIGKLLYPRTFSLITIPKIVVIPSIITSLDYFRLRIKHQEKEFLFLPLLFFIYLAIIVFHRSMGRYLFPISPICIVFFIFFLRNKIFSPKFFIKTITLTSIFITLGIYFELDFIIIKIALNIILISSIMFLYYTKFQRKNLTRLACIIVVSAIASITISVALFFSYSRGQINQSRKWGNNKECKEIVLHFKEEETIFINDTGWNQLPHFFRKDTLYNPEWTWDLTENIPKKYMLKRLSISNTFLLDFEDMDNLYQQCKQRNVQKIAVVESNIQDEPFMYQYEVGNLSNQDWLTLTQTIPLKNKTLHIFSIETEN